jgi:hypothetical protein
MCSLSCSCLSVSPTHVVSENTHHRHLHSPSLSRILFITYIHAHMSTLRCIALKSSPCTPLVGE